MSREIVDAIKVLEQEKGLDSETLMAALEDALLSAYKKSPGSAKYARVDLDRETADFRVFELILPAELEEKLLAQVAEEQEPEIDPATGEMREPEEPELDPEILAPYEDQIEAIDVTPDNFGRIAAQTAKQVVLQRIREAERMMMYEEFQDRVGELITGIIQQSDNRYTLVQLRDRVEALLPRSEQIYSERYDHGMRVKAVITDVSAEGKGPSVVVSRKSPELIKKLFALEVPEIADELVEVVGVAREPGFRSKIAVVSHADGVDPVGACVGPRGSRVRMVVSELRGEKIDIIPYNEEPARFVAKALSPARVREVLVDDEDRQATVIVPDDQLSLAIGREGQNARLAAKLTGWRVDIVGESEFAEQADDDEGFEDEEEVADGRCAAVLSAGRRCPNASLGGIPLLRPAPAPGAGALRAPTRSPSWRRSARTRSRCWPTSDSPATARSRRSSRAPRRRSTRPPRRPRPRRPPAEEAEAAERGHRGGRAGGRGRARGRTRGDRGGDEDEQMRRRGARDRGDREPRSRRRPRRPSRRRDRGRGRGAARRRARPATPSTPRRAVEPAASPKGRREEQS